MKLVSVNLQSISDIVTNSSSEVYMYTNGVNLLKEFINAVLKSSGSNQTCDDLFYIVDDGNSYRITPKVENKMIESQLNIINELFYVSDY